MQVQGNLHSTTNSTDLVAIADTNIREKYLERAIREINQLTRDLQECQHCARHNFLPVIGSGHPQADIMLLKYGPVTAEVEEGVAFYGRSGMALMKAFRRLSIDPLSVYGTLCVKCPINEDAEGNPTCIGTLAEEITIVSPKMIVVMGDEALEALNDLQLPLAETIKRSPGTIQKLTHSTDALYVPNIDDAFEDDTIKREFWNAFRPLGEWHAALHKS